MCRLVALATMQRAGLIGRIGFKQKLFQRHVRHQFAQTIGTRKRKWPADAQQKSQLMQLHGLLLTAGKTMHHAAQPAHVANAGDHRIHCAARMHDDGQVKVTRQPQLCIERRLLRLCIQPIHKKIQPAFAYGDGCLAFDPDTQAVQMLRTMLGDKHRVQAIGRIQAGVVRAHLLQRGPTGRSYRRHDLHGHPRCNRARIRSGAIGIERGSIEMAMAVDQQHVSVESVAAMKALWVFSNAPTARCPAPARGRPTGQNSGSPDPLKTERQPQETAADD